MIIKFVPQSLRMSAAGAEGGAGAGGAGGQQQPGTPQTPAPGQQTQQSPVTPANGDSAPVTRAELNAFADALVAKLGQAQPKSGEVIPEWAKALHGEIVELKSERKTELLAAKKQQLVNGALAGVPDANRGLATLALEGLMASTGVSLDGANVDIAQLATQLGGTLRTQHASLFTTPGSRFTAIPATADGKFDWSGVDSMAEVPPEMISKIPDDVYRRLRHGGSAGGVMPDGSIVPRNRFH